MDGNRSTSEQPETRQVGSCLTFGSLVVQAQRSGAAHNDGQESPTNPVADSKLSASPLSLPNALSESTPLLGSMRATTTKYAAYMRTFSEIRKDPKGFLTERARGVFEQRIRPALEHAGIRVPTLDVEAWDAEHGASQPWPVQAVVEVIILAQKGFGVFATNIQAHSILIAPTIALGHLSTKDLAASTISTALASITGYSLLNGVLASLDARLSGCDHRTAQRWCLRAALICGLGLFPILSLWASSGTLLKKVSAATSTYANEVDGLLETAALGMPAWVVGEVSKRYLGSQGKSTITTRVLTLAAPMNAGLSYLLVNGPIPALQRGPTGAPLAAVFSHMFVAFMLGACVIALIIRAALHEAARLAGVDGRLEAAEGWVEARAVEIDARVETAQERAEGLQSMAKGAVENADRLQAQVKSPRSEAPAGHVSYPTDGDTAEEHIESCSGEEAPLLGEASAQPEINNDDGRTHLQELALEAAKGIDGDHVHVEATKVDVRAKLAEENPEDRGFIRGTLELLRGGVSGVGKSAAETWSKDFSGLSACMLGPVALASQAVLLATSTTIFQVPRSVSEVMTMRTQKLLERGDIARAKVAVSVALLGIVITAVIISNVLIATDNKFGEMFNPDPSVIKSVCEVLPVIAVYQALNALGGWVNGVLDVLGKQAVFPALNASADYLIGIPLGLYLTFVKQWGLSGLWVGLVMSHLYALVGALGVLWKVDWAAAAGKATKNTQDPPSEVRVQDVEIVIDRA
ncbi:hypothetical protein CONPUDRAFT_141349 [Coniophora puteana RWD-64-598 SS2]|uniref:MATE efflux family protein n=1 Tax=Coniophora puteana (strain RWD-64-598) TaxID=741705 RepID=A0A5M3N6Z4_CONPW|nr:uncharacterized protein CONPUDRAFT_141349 [Coniophora puteana RWD-64-598 SS2]EIW87086.1 hypothetical protein CONPUDRAFT_141349 [Coniophora puteana RWD-64-598 SS2]